MTDLVERLLNKTVEDGACWRYLGGKIKRLLMRTTFSQEWIAYQFGVSRGTVAAIKQGRIWGNIQ